MAEAEAPTTAPAASGGGGGMGGYKGLSISEDVYLKLCKSYFNRYDVDGSRSIDSREELHGLVINLAYYLKLPNTRKDPKIMDDIIAGEGPKPHITIDAFPAWFASKFLEGQDGTHTVDIHGGERLKIQVNTWNVGNEIMDYDLSPFIAPGGGGMDLVVFGVQECKYDEKKTPAGAPELPKSAEFCSGIKKDLHHWFGIIQRHLGDEYIPVEERMLLEMRLIVFARKTLRKDINDIETAQEATGIMHVVGNKGGLLVRFTYKGTSFAFISCHLAAHEGQKHMENRNDNCREVLEGARIGIEAMDVVPQTDHIFWMGDLNYRTEPYKFGMYPDKKGQKLPKNDKPEHREIWHKINNEFISEGKFGELFQHDELQSELAEKRVLCGFEEGEYDFPPTFKVLRRRELLKGSKEDEREPMTEEQIAGNPCVHRYQRWPAYCDRILWHSHPRMLGDVLQRDVNYCPDVLTSDHKPVKSTFEVVLRPPPPALPKAQPADAPDIWITNVMGHNGIHAMDYTGKSDPYLIFLCPEIGVDYEGDDKKIWKSQWKEQTLEPKWDDEEIPILPCKIADKDVLRNGHLVLCMQDHDRVDDDDDMGYGYLPLAKYVDMPEGGDFSVNISLNGQQAGWIKGHICFKYPSATGQRDKRKLKSGGCQCTLL